MKIVALHTKLLDLGFGSTEEWETAPFCGHHYSEGRTFLTRHSDHEGEGFAAIKIGPFILAQYYGLGGGEDGMINFQLSKGCREFCKKWTMRFKCYYSLLFSKTDGKWELFKLINEIWK